ncbi:hypothetical protein ACFWDK_20030 [Micromonospora chalcea]
MLTLTADPTPAHQPSFWENVGGLLLLSAIAFLSACYWFGFKVNAKCLVIAKTTQKPCMKDGKVLVGCRHHKWKKTVAWIRHMGASRSLDPWFYRLHMVPPSFAPMPMPAVVPASPAQVSGAAPEVPGRRMTREARFAMWSLIFGILQAGTGIVALAIDLSTGK